MGSNLRRLIFGLLVVSFFCQITCREIPTESDSLENSTNAIRGEKEVRFDKSEKRLYTLEEALKEKNPDNVFELLVHNFDEFPDEIFSFKNLKVLYLRQNSFSYIPRNIKSLKHLEKLIVTHGRLKELPPEIGNLQQLKYLGAIFNKIEILPDGLYELVNLEYLNLTGNPVKINLAKISQLKKLKTLGLGQESEEIYSELEKKRIEKRIPKGCKISW